MYLSFFGRALLISWILAAMTWQNTPNLINWRLATYNVQSVAGRRTLDDVLEQLSSAHLIGLQGLALSRSRLGLPEGTSFRMEKRKGYMVFQWPFAITSHS
ncbi:unnamed protein product, partial [Polarella glacialis]